MLRSCSLFLSLLFSAAAALAHPGHGALEIHWHLEDVALAVLGFLVISLLVFLVRKALKR